MKYASSISTIVTLFLYNVFVNGATKPITQLSRLNSANKERLTGPKSHLPLIIAADVTTRHGLLLSQLPSKYEILNMKYLYACPAKDLKTTGANAISSQNENYLVIQSSQVTSISQDDSEESLIVQIERLRDMENKMKCEKPVIPKFVHLLQRRNGGDTLTVHGIGFEVNLGWTYRNIDNREGGYEFFPLKENSRWYDVIEITFDPNKLNVKDVKYQMNAADLRKNKFIVNTDKVRAYELGKRDLFGNLPIEELYELDNQKNIFSILFDDESLRKNYFNIEDGKYLIPCFLAPPDVFMIPHLREATRSYGNIAPMWKVIRENSWKNIENYLHFVTKALVSLEIVSGTYDVLRLPQSGEVALAENQVQVPLAFYKMILLPKNPNNAKTTLLGVLIVTINNPYEKVDGILCKKNECEELGWNAIQNDDYTKGLTTCCRLSDEILEQLQVDVKFDTDVSLNLKLLETPHPEDKFKNTKVIEYIEYLQRD